MASVPILVFSILSLLVVVQCADEKIYPWNCSLFRCGKLGQLSHPFSNKTQPECGAFVVDGCDQPVQRIQLVKGSGKWYEVLDISQSSTMHIRDRELEQDLKSHNCETLNNLSLPISSYFEVTIDPNITLFKCNRTLNSSNTPVTNINYTSCNDIYLNRPNKPLPAVPSHCPIIQLPAAAKSVNSEIDLFPDVVPEFYLQPHILPECTDCITRGGHCRDDNEGKFECAGPRPKGKAKARWSVRILAAAGSTAGIAFVLVIGCFLWIRYSPNQHVVPWMKRKQNIINVEAILKGVGSLAPKRYSYSEVKKITRSFKNKLGRGGYGWVYQGELHDGRLVAVKILKESKGDGEEFVNEVASISRTAHVNIVALLGFCFEGSARALIYEFMPNGSLESFIYDENPSKTCHQLGWETLYQIALGIARGLEYLHRGCNTKILHFDIKPHNILLNDDFCPKISDFGLAKLCPGKDSIISMLGARGTPGYIAPEVFCRNFGGISHKSDVYSYGMMVLEMVGGRKNSVATADHTSEIYFPHWIYRRLEVGDELVLQGIRDEQEYEKAKKMVIVGLCCIQTDPSNRPPMNRVMEMLHGSLESLQIPPSPFLSSPPRAPLADSSARRQSAIDSVNSAVHNEASFSSSQFHER